MYEYDRIDSPLLLGSLGRGIALLRWSGFWSAIVLPVLHVPLLVVSGLSPSSTPVVLALWLANALALVVGRHHVPHGRRASSGGDRQ